MSRNKTNCPYNSSEFCPNPSALNGVSVSVPKCSADAQKDKMLKDTWTDKLKMFIFATVAILLILLMLGIVVAAIATLFDDDRALGRAIHRWKVTRNGGTNGGGNAMSTNGDGDRN
ncbi:hypothetical protein niasHS_005869 [Heterodera schachtii]|uniref:Uncharacterized protein n=2 Tax=Heterodera TaxID=34509 RepID=A0ABD2JS39_HETSC